MSKEREMIEKLCSFQMPYSDWLLLIADAEELLAQPEQNKAEAIMPNGVRVSNVYDAYEEGRKSVMSEQQPEAWIIVNKETGYRTQVSDLTPFLYHREIFEVIPLYTAPPKREPLSTDAMLRLIAEHRDFPLNLVRAIEKAHGIGGGE